MSFDRPISEIIQERYSCRTYREDPIDEATRQRLEGFLASTPAGPFGSPVRFKLVAASDSDRSALQGLGTYGFIRGAPAFILGAVGQGDRNLEDFGYAMEEAILFATGMGLGTCWLGGTFQQSNFAQKMDLLDGESMPCVTPVGYPAERRALMDRLVRLGARGDRRLPWEQLFFDRQWGSPLSKAAAGPYAEALAMVRLGPSASNRQPWRVVRTESAWHFYLRRSPGYREGSRLLMPTTDLQRVDLGIALCHFELVARELGLSGSWVIQAPRDGSGMSPGEGAEAPGESGEYRASWVEGESA